MPSWRRPRKSEMPRPGDKVVVVRAPWIDLETGELLRSFCAYVRYDQKTWRAIDENGFYTATLLPEDEGITWCRGWEGDAVAALLAAQALA